MLQISLIYTRGRLGAGATRGHPFLVGGRGLPKILRPLTPGFLGCRIRWGKNFRMDRQGEGQKLTNPIVWGIKCGVFNCADSDSGWIFKIRTCPLPLPGGLGAEQRGGAKMNFPIWHITPCGVSNVGFIIVQIPNLDEFSRSDPPEGG